MDRERFERILIGADATVRRAIKAIDEGVAHLALVVDADQRLVGIVTDGDVRRALLHGTELDGPVTPIVHHGPVTADEGASAEEIAVLMEEHGVEQIPLLRDGRVVDVVVVRDLVHGAHEHPVVIVAGGEGRRLRPLTEETPKPMLDVGGRPLLETILGQVRDAGFTKVFMLVNYRAEAIESHFGSGEELGLDIRYVREPEPLGSAGGLKFVREELLEPFIVLNADLLTDVNLDALLRFHRVEGNVITIGVKQYVLEVPYGVVDLEGTAVTALREKPELKFFVSAGIYALSPEAVGFLPDRAGQLHMTELIDAALAGGARVGSFPVHEYWLDIGHVGDYERAHEDHTTRLRRAR
jgi:dTDP-glucose pyrophosphorylase